MQSLHTASNINRFQAIKLVCSLILPFWRLSIFNLGLGLDKCISPSLKILSIKSMGITNVYRWLQKIIHSEMPRNTDVNTVIQRRRQTCWILDILGQKRERHFVVFHTKTDEIHKSDFHPPCRGCLTRWQQPGEL